MAAAGGAGGGAGAGGDGDGGGDKGFFSKHWGEGHHKGDAEYVERNKEAVAQEIIARAAAANLADDTKIVVNFDLGGGVYNRYFIVVVFYHPGPPAYLNFHSSRRSRYHGDAEGEPNTQVFNMYWRNRWK